MKDVGGEKKGCKSNKREGEKLRRRKKRILTETLDKAAADADARAAAEAPAPALDFLIYAHVSLSLSILGKERRTT